MPRRRAVSSTVFVPTRRSTRTVARLIECSSAYWYVMIPWYCFSKFCGCQGSCFGSMTIVIGASRTVSAGVKPCSIAVRKTTGLNAEPTWRSAWTARSNFERLKS